MSKGRRKKKKTLKKKIIHKLDRVDSIGAGCIFPFLDIVKVVTTIGAAITRISFTSKCAFQKLNAIERSRIAPETAGANGTSFLAML